VGQIIVYNNPDVAKDAKKPNETVVLLSTLLDLNKIKRAKESNRKAHYVFTSNAEERELAKSIDETVGMQCYELV
jgi:hypothetical protein